MGLQIPKANRPLSAVSEDTRESGLQGCSGPSQRDLGDRAGSGTDPLPLKSCPSPLLGNPGRWAAQLSFLSSSREDAQRGGTEVRALDF